MTFRLTFNKPTITRNFDGEKIVAVRVKIVDGVAMFLPVSDQSAKDVLTIAVRERGGGEAFVEGTKAEELRAALTNPAGPFFTLHRREGGWMAAVPWTRDSAPPKPEPHLRTWQPDNRSAALAKIPEINTESLSGFLHMVTKARELLEDFAANKRPGRPPREVVQARQDLALFDRLSHEVLVSTAMPPVTVMTRKNRMPLDLKRATARNYAKTLGGKPSKGGATRFRSRVAAEASV
jgi:hypothetical protein